MNKFIFFTTKRTKRFIEGFFYTNLSELFVKRAARFIEKQKVECVVRMDLTQFEEDYERSSRRSSFWCSSFCNSRTKKKRRRVMNRRKKCKKEKEEKKKK